MEAQRSGVIALGKREINKPPTNAPRLGLAYVPEGLENRQRGAYIVEQDCQTLILPLHFRFQGFHADVDHAEKTLLPGRKLMFDGREIRVSKKSHRFWCKSRSGSA